MDVVLLRAAFALRLLYLAVCRVGVLFLFLLRACVGVDVELRSLVDLSEDGRVAESALEEPLLAQEVPILVIALGQVDHPEGSLRTLGRHRPRDVAEDVLLEVRGVAGDEVLREGEALQLRKNEVDPLLRLELGAGLLGEVEEAVEGETATQTERVLLKVGEEEANHLPCISTGLLCEGPQPHQDL